MGPTDSWQPSNPVERRFMQAHADWLTFAERPQARLLYWQVNEDDLYLLNTYFQVQKENGCCTMQFYDNFTCAEDYATLLSEHIIDFYEQRREGSLAQGINAHWSAPERESNQTGTQYLLKIANELMQYHPDIFPGFLFVLTPSDLKSLSKMENWLKVLLTETDKGPWTTNRIRYVIYTTEPNLFKSLLADDPQRVQFLQARYYSENVPREMIAESNERGDSGKFRRLFVELTETLKNNDRQRLESLSKSALAITDKAGWFDQSVVVHLIAGAAYLSWKDNKNSLQAYEDALKAAENAKAAEHPAGNKLIVNAIFGICSVYLIKKDYETAAGYYDRIPPYSLDDRDYILTVEADRMRADCWEKAGEYDKAIDAAFEGIDAGLLMEPEFRLQSSLPILTHWLYKRMSRLFLRYDEMADKFAQLYGEEWKDIVSVDPLKQTEQREQQA